MRSRVMLALTLILICIAWTQSDVVLVCFKVLQHGLHVHSEDAAGRSAQLLTRSFGNLRSRLRFGSALPSVLPWDQSQSSTVRISVQHNEQYLTTIVTAYFDLHSKAKHSAGAYADWVASFYQNVDHAMVIFTDRQTIREVEQLRAGKPTLFYVYEDLWGLPKLAAMSQAYKTIQHARDPEGDLHIPELYMIWNSKLFMLNKTSDEDWYSSEFFVWVDSGAFRAAHKLKFWPDDQQVKAVFKGNENRILLGLISQPPLEDMQTWSKSRGPYVGTSDVVEGTFFGGRREALRWYAEVFYEVHDDNVDAGFFVGKDQSLMTEIAFLYPEKFLLLDTAQVDGSCSDPWFYFEQALASQQEKNSGCNEPNLLRWDELLRKK